jgi:hypothetical protein
VYPEYGTNPALAVGLGLAIIQESAEQKMIITENPQMTMRFNLQQTQPNHKEDGGAK